MGGPMPAWWELSTAVAELPRGRSVHRSATVSVTNLVANVIQAAGSETQKQTYLPKLCSGEFPIGSFALSVSEINFLTPLPFFPRRVQEWKWMGIERAEEVHHQHSLCGYFLLSGP